MKIKLLVVAFLASTVFVGGAYAGSHHGSGGSLVSSHPGMARSGGGVPSFHSMPMGGRMMYSGQHFSSAGMRGSMYGQRYVHSTSNGPTVAHQFSRGSMGINRTNQIGSNSHLAQNGAGFARSNGSMRNQHIGPNQAHNNLAPNWHNHVIAQHSANWHNWNHNSDHWWHGHRCSFINGSWFVFGAGFYPWWPWWWDYPYYGYGYGYGYPYGYGYGYPYGYGYQNGYGYDNSYGYEDSGAYPDQSGYQNGYGSQAANSTVAAAQDRLSHDGFYHGQIDGVMGPETRHAIVRFQTNHGLHINGELSSETLNALGLQHYASGY